MSRRYVVSSLAVTVAAGCCPPVAPTAPAPVQPAAPAAPETSGPPVAVEPAAPPAPPPPPRADLSVLPQPVPATIAVPAGATVVSAEASNLTADGFRYATAVARISGGGLPGTIEISTGDQLGWTPTTLAADLADVGRQGHAEVTSGERPDGNWAAAYRLTSSCYVRAWSPTAGLWCEAETPGQVGVPCEQVQAVVDVCLTLEPRGAAAPPRLDVVSSFPNLHDAGAIETAVAAGRAVAANDLAAFTALLGPGRFKLGKRKVDAKQLAAAVAKAGRLSRLLGHDCVPATERAWTCRWNSDGDGASGKLRILARDGYGVVPSIDLVRQRDRSWRVAGFGSVDLGAP
jgi:hypothetical protein